MQTLVVVSVVFAACYILTLPVFSTRWSLLGIQYLFFSGTEFLLLGFLLGPAGLGLLPPAVLSSLDPVIHLALGWAGLIFGLQFERRLVILYPVRRYLLAFLQALATSAVAAAGAWLVLPLLFPGADPRSLLQATLILGICAAPTSPSSIHYFSRVFRIRGRVDRLLKFVVAVDGIPAAVMLGLFAGLGHRLAGAGGASIAGWKWLVLATALGVLLGLLLSAMVELPLSRDELLLFVVGMVVLASGLARYLHLSVLYVGFVMGLTVANSAWNREEVHKVAAYAEKPLYLTFLVLAGTLMTLDDPRVPLLAGILVALRVIGKVAGNAPWRWVRREPLARSPFLGLALLSQGPLAIVLAMEFDFLLRADPAWAAVIQPAVTAVLVAVRFSEVLSPFFIRTIVPRAEPAPAGAPER